MRARVRSCTLELEVEVAAPRPGDPAEVYLPWKGRRRAETLTIDVLVDVVSFVAAAVVVVAAVVLLADVFLSLLLTMNWTATGHCQRCDC